MKNRFFSCMLALVVLVQVEAQEYERYKKLTDTTITSKFLGIDKSITVTVPFEWQEDLDRDFPLIVVFDRQNPRSHQYMLNTIDYLTSNEQMPAAVIISVESTQEHRFMETLHEVSREIGKATSNEKFVFEELIPLAEELYQASSFRVFIGHSRYGYFTTSLFSARINELNGVIAISPFFAQTNVDLTDSIRALNAQKFTAQKYFRYGIGNDFPEDYHHMEAALKEVTNEKISAKGVYFKEADHNVTPGLVIGVALYEIFEEWSTIQAKYMSNEQKDLSVLSGLEDKIVQHYGSDLAFSLGILNGKGWFFYNEGDYEKAIEAWEKLAKVYPNFSEVYLYMMQAQLDLKQDLTENRKRFTASLTKSTIYNEEEKQELLEELKALTK